MTVITNDEGELTDYTGAWVDSDTEDTSPVVEPVNTPNYRPPKGKDCNGPPMKGGREQQYIKT